MIYKNPILRQELPYSRKKSDELGAFIDNEILTYIAENIDTNIRDLEGALSTAIAYAKGDGRNTINLEDLQRASIQGLSTRESTSI